MTIDEAIAHEKIVSEPCSILCMNTTNRNDCIECRAYHKQLAEWLEELKAIKEMDLDIPQHFTKEQSGWIKAYCIKRNIEFYNKSLDDFVKFANTMPIVEAEDGEIRPMRLEEMAEQLKEGVLNEED